MKKHRRQMASIAVDIAANSTKAPSMNMSKKVLYAMVQKRDRIIHLMGESAAKEMKRMSNKLQEMHGQLKEMDVDRRITVLEREQLAIDKLNDNTDMQLRVVTHHRDELLTEVKQLKKLLNSR